MRVAVRRMRATLKAARPLLDADLVRRAAGGAGLAGRRARPGARPGRAAAPPAPGDREPARRRADRGRALLGALERERTHGPRGHARGAHRSPLLRAAGAARRHGRRAAADARRRPTRASPRSSTSCGPRPASSGAAVEQAGDDPPDEVLHALRIRGKRVRYTGELVAPSLRGTPAGKQVKRLLSATDGAAGGARRPPGRVRRRAAHPGAPRGPGRHAGTPCSWRGGSSSGRSTARRRSAASGGGPGCSSTPASREAAAWAPRSRPEPIRALPGRRSRGSPTLHQTRHHQQPDGERVAAAHVDQHAHQHRSEPGGRVADAEREAARRRARCGRRVRARRSRTAPTGTPRRRRRP